MKKKRFLERLISLMLSTTMVMTAVTPMSASALYDEPAELVEESELDDSAFSEIVWDGNEDEKFLDDGYELSDPEEEEIEEEMIDSGTDEEEDEDETFYDPDPENELDLIEEFEETENESEEELSCGEAADADEELDSDADPMEEEEAFYEFEDRNNYVTAILKAPEKVPEGAEFTVTPVTPDTDGYNYDAYMEALNTETADPSTDPLDIPSYTEKNTIL